MSDVPTPTYRVLIPAHDEAGMIAGTIASVLAQLPAGARPLVIADNCTDDTAQQARAAGAEVVERHNPGLRGKGHALAFGVEHLRHNVPRVVVIVDADCMPETGSLDLLATAAANSGRPVQGTYLMCARAGSPLRVRMAAFAWALRNQVRPLGMHRLGLPCQLMGSGMAFPWACIESVGFGSGHLTEDLELGVKLAAAGHAPRFCPGARVMSWFPHGAVALDAQRRRWEHGHLSMIFTALATLRPGRAGSASVLLLALDLCIPPLALLAAMLVVSAGLGALMAGGAWAWVAAIAAASVSGFAAAVLLAWWQVGRQWVSLRELLSAPLYVLSKLPVYASFVLRRQKEWVRTSRQPPG